MFVYAVKKRVKLTTSPIPVRLLASPYQYAFQRARQTQATKSSNKTRHKTHDPAVACIIIPPHLFPKVDLNHPPPFLSIKSLNQG
ncbi:hypothetical protein C343_01666 [Cryptococcus neoformans C23]|nr:hypothetical protein C343_01666 [Cryptococcus neoformans var. grubii C23]OXG34818.1 hypothetical protein C359_06275 [Cryptococcus neoformans var. grubii Bt120]OXG98013.1 hypothetical protein C345_01666 [Cryptococcus neoformans var. grubii A2-102-5]